ncbi:MAG TPA: PorT family protein [Candidatus Barnesiella excrementavium]|nr:PorT family protein [Candidatus Barnesiella excrementavium]
MKRLVPAICIALSFALATQAQVKELNVSKRFNWGIRLGVNAPLVDIRHMSLDGVTVDESDSESSLGLTGSFIGRYNIKRHYIQLEVGMHQSHTRLYNPDYGLSKINTSAYAVDVPVLYGYNITKHGPFLMNLFAGPRVSYICNETSRINTSGNVSRNLVYNDKPNSFSFYAVGGLSTTIGHLYIDFRYAYCIRNSKDQSFNIGLDSTTGQVKLSRTINELSISIGYLW